MSMINATTETYVKGDKVWFTVPSGKSYLGTVLGYVTEKASDVCGALINGGPDEETTTRICVEYGDKMPNVRRSTVKLPEYRLTRFDGSLRPTTIGIRGGWIEIMDKETGKTVMTHDISWLDTDHWVKSAVVEAAMIGFKIKTKIDEIDGLTILDLS